MSGVVTARLAPASRGLLVVAAAVLVGWALHAMASVVIPVVLALLITLIVAPVDRAIATSLPRRLEWVAHLSVMAVMLVVLATFTLGLVYSAEQLLSRLPSPDRMEELLSSRIPDIADAQGAGADPMPSWLSDFVARGGDALGRWLAESAGALLQGVAGATGTLVSATLLVIFLMLLILAERRTWEEKADRLWRQHAAGIRDAVASASTKLRQWLMVRALIGVLSATVYVLWLLPFGIDLLGVWGTITFLLVFIPNIGAVISGVLPTLYVFATQDLTTALWVGAGLFVIENVMGNWIDPLLQGRRIALSPAVIFVGLLFWSWVWGVAGAFLSSPMMVIIMVFAAHVQPLRPLALLLSDQSDMGKLDARLRA